MERENMVEVRAAYKRYGSNPPILKGLNMTVKKGTIYGLLGPSGCGKTTLLSCIVGRKFLDSGEVRLGLCKRSEVGYMPQDVALYEDFTIDEVYQFFGTLFGLPSDILEKRSRELTDLLDLPPTKRVVKTLSGGQQRRVSFAVALLHNPKLLILDEPTVGVDPVLCHNIWQYLVKIAAAENKTIIITTHYIEEAKQSTTIGLMREGILLTEARPTQLISSQSCSSLEEAFLILSKKQHEDNENDRRKGLTRITYPAKTKKKISPFIETQRFNMSRFAAQLRKNLLWIQRNLYVLLFILMVPAFQSLLFCITFGRDPENLSIGLVSEELSTANSIVCHNFYNLTYSPILECDIPETFTCQFWKQLATKMNVVLYYDLAEAKAAVSKNEIWGVMFVSQNFTRAIEERLSQGIHTSDLIIDQSAIQVWMDMSNYIISSLLKRDIAKSLIEFIKDILEICGVARDVGSIPIRFNDPVFGSSEPIFAHSSAAAFICSFIFFFTMVFTSGGMKMEAQTGISERSMVAGMTRLEIICAHLVVQFILMTLQKLLMMIVMYVMYSNPLQGNIILTVILLYFISSVGISFGFLLSEMLNEERLISYAGIGTTMMLFMINGCMWPIEGAHAILRSTSKYMPIVAAVYSYNSITTRGYGLEDNTVVMGFVSCIIWTIIFSVMSHMFAMRKK